MTLGLLGKKIGMTRIYNDAGECVPVTVVQAGPCPVTQKKTKDTDGYDAIQLGFDEVKKVQRVNKPKRGHFAKKGLPVYKHLTEFKPANLETFEVGSLLSVASFSKGDIISVQGTSKGKGFQGSMNKGRSGGPATHGSHFHRTPGSIGMRAWPGRVLKNTSLPGHIGDETVTVRHLEVAEVVLEDNLLLIKGAVPGARSGIVKIVNHSKDYEKRSNIIAGKLETTNAGEVTKA